MLKSVSFLVISLGTTSGKVWKNVVFVETCQHCLNDTWNNLSTDNLGQEYQILVESPIYATEKLELIVKFYFIGIFAM